MWVIGKMWKMIRRPKHQPSVRSANVYSNERVISDKGSNSHDSNVHYTTRKDFSWMRALMEATLLLRAACIVSEAGNRADIGSQAW